MSLIRFLLTRRPTVVFSAWTMEENEIKRTYWRNAGGHNDNVDLDTT